MQKHFVLLLIAAVSSVAGCFATIPVSDTAVTLDVNFNWTSTSDCASTSPSPPITVSNIPDGTKYLKVTMVDLNNTDAKLEHAQQIAGHSDPKTTLLYDRRSDEISLDEVEKIGV